MRDERGNESVTRQSSPDLSPDTSPDTSSGDTLRAARAARTAVLLVDPDVHSRAIFSAMLEFRGLTTTAVADAEQGAALLREFAPRALVLEPDGSGCRVSCHALFEDAKARAIPVVAITSHGLGPDIDALRCEGYCAVLVKPISPHEVVAAVERAIGVER